MGFEDTIHREGDTLSGGLKDILRHAQSVRDAQVEKVEGWFRSKLGYGLRDHTQGVQIPTAGSVKAEKTAWVKEQLEKGLIEEVEPPSAGA